jgi:GNAT superfamily N-acetyltransferase
VYFSVLWVEESLRNKGNGTKLLRMMENEAVRLGCKCAHVDIYSFEAKPFYKKTGIRCLRRLKNYPKGHKKHCLKKNLLQQCKADAFKMDQENTWWAGRDLNSRPFGYQPNALAKLSHRPASN